MANYMFDKEFLKQLDNYQHKEKYAKITALTLEEKPIETIEGKVTAGSINIDGASAVRRTCSLTLLAYDTKVTDFYWGLQTKFKLEIGLKNEINPKYPDIIWFKQGIYSITSFSSSISGANYTINISGKDKMCLLNGELGGVFPFSVDLGTEEIKDVIIRSDGTKEKIVKVVELTIPSIIKEMVHTYGGEPYYNIIINDLDNTGLELMEYRGKDPIYIIRVAEKQDKIAVSLNGEQKCYINGKEITFIELADKQENENAIFEFTSTKDPETTKFILERYKQGETVGYKITELTYTGDLIAKVGDSITSILDKLTKMLGDFEYFYNLDGKFIFQKKKTYIQSQWTPIINDNRGVSDFYIDPAAESSPYSYNFNNNYLISQISNSPALDNIKNDFSIWGKRKSVTGQELDVHMRYAIHSKPKQYCSIEVTTEEVNKFIGLHPEFKNMKTQNSILYTAESAGDWRELIYLMAQDYNKYGHLDNFEDKIAAANPNLYPTGRTSYEQYYIDMLGFWRLLYYPEKLLDLEIEWKENYPDIIKEYENIQEKDKVKYLNDQINIILNIKEAQRTEEQNNKLKVYQKILEYIEEIEEAKLTYYLDQNHPYYGWARNIFHSPETLDFWIDFLDQAEGLEQYSVSTIGARPKASSENEVKAIYYRETPNLIYYYPNESYLLNSQQSGYTYIQLQSSMSQLLSLSPQGKSAKNILDEYLNDHLFGAESINITGIPIYYLEPNTRIMVQNNDTNLSGEYIINKITLPLAYNGTMSITANKTIKLLY